MGNALEFILRLTDQLSPAMRSAAAVADSAAVRIRTDLDRTTGSSNRFAYSLNELRAKLDQVNRTRANTHIASQFRVATEEARRLEAQIARLENRGNGGGGLLGGGLGGLLAGAGALALGKEALGMTAEREQQRISFGIMTGGKDKGDRMVSDIVKMANATPFESGDLLKNAQVMKQFGIENEKVLPNLRMLGDISGGNAEKLQGLTLAYAQVQSAQKLQGQDLLQMINNGFNPLSEIAEITGMKYADLKTAMEKGAISSDMVTKAFQHATGEGGKFHGMMDQQSQTLAGRWSTLMDAGKEKLLALGNFLRPVANLVIDFASALLAGEGPALALAAAIGAVAVALSWGSIVAQAMAIKAAVLNVVLAANPAILIVAGIMALVAAIIYAYNHFERFRGFVYGAWEAIKGFALLIKDFVVDRLKGMVSGIAGIGEALFHFFTGDWKKAWEVGKKAAGDLVGVGAVQNAIENGKKIGENVRKGYNQGVAEVAAKNAPKAPAAKPKGVNPVTANDPAFKGLADFKSTGDGSDKDSKKRSENINAGGSRPITITIGKQIERLEVHVASAKESAEEIGALVREELRRVLYSVTSMAT